MGALDGVRVIEIGEGICAPYCGQLCADAGAEVLKVEPSRGDWARQMGPPFVNGESPVFLCLNRNKKSVVLNLETGEGREALKKLVKDADVVIEDLAPGFAEDNGIGYDALRQINDKLIYLGISPYGEKGPYARKPATELTIQAMSEYTASLGVIGEPPVRLGTDVADTNTAVFGFQGILSAYFHRLRTGEGQKVAVNMFGSLLSMRGTLWSAQSDGIESWYGFHCDSYVKPPDHGYQTGTLPVYFTLRRGNEEAYSTVLIEFEMFDAINDPRFGEGGRDATGTGRLAHEVKPIWEAGFASKTADEVCEIINRNDGEAVPITDYEYLFAHPQTEAIDIVRQVDHPKAGKFRVLRAPWKFSEIPEGKYAPPPALGQHTEEVLRKAGLSAQEISRLGPARKG